MMVGTLQLATGGENRDPALPDLPTMAEGLPGFTSMQWTGIVAPPETPAAIANQLSDAVAAALKEPDVVKMVSDLRMQAIGSSTANAAAFMATERERWGGIIRAIGAKAE